MKRLHGSWVGHPESILVLDLPPPFCRPHMTLGEPCVETLLIEYIGTALCRSFSSSSPYQWKARVADMKRQYPVSNKTKKFCFHTLLSRKRTMLREQRQISAAVICKQYPPRDKALAPKLLRLLEQCPLLHRPSRRLRKLRLQ